ncbi:MAG TPA: PEP/pyruvate-binding domain-containing protein [Nitrospirota bacterium]|nr:PEP/pyruvate-binding domain-containing protein [Nitrospirota bacterium]
MGKFANFFNRKESQLKDDAAASKKKIKDKYASFQDLLKHNDNVLILISDIDEKLKFEYLFDQQYVTKTLSSIKQSVQAIITNLNALSGGKYGKLHDRFLSINDQLDQITSQQKVIQVSDLVIPLGRLEDSATEIAGGKIARLSDMKHRLNMPVPEGFSITAFAFKRFLEHNGLADKVNALLRDLPSGNSEELTRLCQHMRKTVSEASIPPDLQDAIDQAVANLKSSVQHSPLLVSVRSSAIHEDSDMSFAGQYATFLNVPEHAIAQKYKEVVASIFRPRAVYYFKTKGFSEAEIVMSVGVIQMIDARAGGVAYTKDPNNPDSDTLIINAANGLGKTVVDGTVIPDTYAVSRTNHEILFRNISDQRVMLVCADGGDIAEKVVTDQGGMAAALSDAEVTTLAGYATELEKAYGKPQDIEWAVDKNGGIFLLQSRPLKTAASTSAHMAVPRRVDHYPLLVDKGLIASRGVGCGRAFVVRNGTDLKAFPDGGVLVASHMSTDFVLVMEKASAFIIEKGSITGHMASLAREYAVPTIVNAENAMQAVQDGEEITVDAVNCNVYRGRVEEIMKCAASRESSFRETRVYRVLESAFALISPLNLVNPDAETFAPEHCRTYHDITRFSHEKAMNDMFSIGSDHDMDSCSAVPLRAGIPMDAYLIDLDCGLAENVTKATSADIRSLPFASFLKGMKSMRWPEPRAADVKGFLGMVANTAQIPEAELRETADRSYAVISSNYMNFSIRLGYHFSAVESYLSDVVNSNYIKFLFKGGGATTDRRLRRIRLITEILKKLGFGIEIKGDLMNATLPKRSLTDTSRTLEVLGKLTAYTKQLDMAMYNDAITDLFIEDFLRDHVAEEQ